MARLDDLKSAFRQCRGTFKYADFEWMMTKLEYEIVKLAGKTGGSRRRFGNKKTGHLVTLDKPHDGIMTFGMIKRLRDDLIGRGVL